MNLNLRSTWIVDLYMIFPRALISFMFALHTHSLLFECFPVASGCSTHLSLQHMLISRPEKTQKKIGRKIYDHPDTIELKLEFTYIFIFFRAFSLAFLQRRNRRISKNINIIWRTLATSHCSWTFNASRRTNDRELARARLLCIEKHKYSSNLVDA